MQRAKLSLRRYSLLDLALQVALIIMALIISFFLTVTFYQDSYAQLAVHDPTTFQQLKLNYIESINAVSELRENVQAAKDTILEAKKIKEGIGEVRNMMSTIYNNTFGLVGELQRLREDLIKTPGEIQSFLDEIKSNADCLFSDMDKYQQVETIYKARYVFKDSEGGTPNYPDDDPYIWKDGSQMAGAYDPVQLKENPCGHTTTYYTKALSQVEEEKAILDRIIGIYTKTEEEAAANEKFYEDMEKKVAETETQKETMDTMKVIQWKMLAHLESIDRTTLDHLKFIVGRVHDPNKLLRTPGISDEVKAMISVKGISFGNATEYKKRSSILRANGSAVNNTLLN